MKLTVLLFPLPLKKNTSPLNFVKGGHNDVKVKNKLCVTP